MATVTPGPAERGEPRRSHLIGEILASLEALPGLGERASVLAAVATRLAAQGEVAQALRAVRLIPDGRTRSDVLRALAPHLPDGALAEAFISVLAIQDQGVWPNVSRLGAIL